MARNVFFSFHYQRDIVRVNQIRNLPEIVDQAAVGFNDASLWEEAKKKGDAEIKRMIDKAVKGTSVSIVCIGYKTAGRKFINYEIEQSIARGNAIFGLQINHLKNFQGETDPVGATPALLIKNKIALYKYVDHHTLKTRIETEAKAAGI
jgi:hypothetical protein